MIKYFCDRCGKESKGTTYCMNVYAYDGLGYLISYICDKHLCEECTEKLMAIKDQLKHEQDILDMTDADIELLCYTFKVGDKVITDDGRTGTITSICDCERCKSRGFYEPTVDFGDYTDYIMISDKEGGFKSYYQIGDRVFGNLNEESVIKELEEIGRRYNQLVKQQGMIHLLRYKKENTNEI